MLKGVLKKVDSCPALKRYCVCCEDTDFSGGGMNYWLLIMDYWPLALTDTAIYPNYPNKLNFAHLHICTLAHQLVSTLTHFHLLLKYSLKFFQLGAYHHGAIRIGVLVIVVIVLVVIFCRIKLGRRFQRGNHRIGESAAVI